MLILRFGQHHVYPQCGTNTLTAESLPSNALFESPFIKLGLSPAALPSFKEVPVIPKLQFGFPNVTLGLPPASSCIPIMWTPNLGRVEPFSF